MTSKKALILHSWYGQLDKDWLPWVKEELTKKGYEVLMPQLPTMDTAKPDMPLILDFINSNYKLDENTVVIGHSLGCLLSLRLAEKQKFLKMFLVSGWDFDDLCEGHVTFWPNKINHAEIKKNVKEIYVVTSENDPYFTLCTAEEMTARLGGKMILVKQAGHFTEKTGVKSIPQILEFFLKSSYSYCFNLAVSVYNFWELKYI